MSKKMQLVIAGSVFLGLILVWIGWRHGRTEADEGESSAGNSGEVTAGVVRVQRGTIAQSLTIAGAFKPFQDVDVHAKVAGYIKKIYVDVGSRVNVGQTLAVLEVPELAAQLAGADVAVRAMCQRLQQAASKRPDWWPNRNWTTRERRIWKEKRRYRARKRH